MITEEERAKLKVGDVVYATCEHGYFRNKVVEHKVVKITAKSIYGNYGIRFDANNQYIYANQSSAIRSTIDRLNKEIKLIQIFVDENLKQLESLENGK